MSKKIYLMLLFSILFFKPETIFGQTLKKKSGICGKTMGAILKTDPKSIPDLDSIIVKDDIFCDNSRYELNANYIISIYNNKNELVYDKHIYLNNYTFLEEADSDGTLKMIKVLSGNNYRIIKIPINKEMGEVNAYKIKSLTLNKTYETKKIKW